MDQTQEKYFCILKFSLTSLFPFPIPKKSKVLSFQIQKKLRFKQLKNNIKRLLVKFVFRAFKELESMKINCDPTFLISKILPFFLLDLVSITLLDLDRNTPNFGITESYWWTTLDHISVINSLWIPYGDIRFPWRSRK